MKCPSSEEIANVLDTIKIGIDKSSFGPLYLFEDNMDITKKKVNQLAFAILPQVMKHVFDKTEFRGADGIQK
ncbi:MAG: hypothetical protein PHI19_06150 [Clostridia bacterium]|nr:hypothetical protein [Clostridia bacterium]